MKLQCEKCDNEYYYALERCPHCAHPGNYSNVLIAADSAERDTVVKRYESALRGADSRGCRPTFEDFASWLRNSRAVVARSFADIDRLAARDNSVQATFYDLIDAGLALPDGSSWESLRRPADEILFPNYRARIRFGALSGDGIGVINYGHFWMTMRDSLIEHRASVFDQNSVTLVTEILASKRLEVAPESLKGHRAIWPDRATLAAAQLSHAITPSTLSDDFPRILLMQGATTADDKFIEVNIWGPITVRTIESVGYRWSLVSRMTPRSLLRHLAASLKVFGVKLEERP